MRTTSTHRRAIALAAALLAGSCDRGDSPSAGDPEGPETAAPAAASESLPFTEGLAAWRANGFTLLVPEDADVVPLEVDPPALWGAILAGPGFLREGEDGTPQPGPPAYRVDVATYQKPDTVALEVWVASRMAERGDSVAPSVTVPIAGQPAVRTGAAAGQPGLATYWLEREGLVVELRLEEDPESPLNGIQRHVQSLILSTFRWSGQSATTPPRPASP